MLVHGERDVPASIARYAKFSGRVGGIVGTAGVIAAAAGATGIGMPLAVIGGAVAVLGSLISTLWGDSPTEQWLKDNAPEYLK